MIDETIDGKYKILRLLGEGGMGAVYEARHTETGRRVAIKVIRDDDAGKATERVRRFQREAKAAGTIDTHHIAQVLDAGTDPTRKIPYIVLEYLAGEDLQQLFKRIPVLAPDVALRIVGQACIGLIKAHEAQVLHRDIKPANLFLAERDEGRIEVKLLDFGIAKMHNDGMPHEVTTLTKTDSFMGSPLYVSPEQARTISDIDARADVWSLGVVLYRALTGAAPHRDQTSLVNLLLAICSEPAPPILERAPWLSRPIAELVHRAIRIDRDQRFPSAAAMLAAIKALTPDGLTLRREDLVPCADPRAQTSTFTAPSAARAMETAPPGSIVSAPETPLDASALHTSHLGSHSLPPSRSLSPSKTSLEPPGARRARRWLAVLALGAVLAVGLSVLGRNGAFAPPPPARPAAAGEHAEAKPLATTPGSAEGPEPPRGELTPAPEPASSGTALPAQARPAKPAAAPVRSAPAARAAPKASPPAKPPSPASTAHPADPLLPDNF